MHLLKNRLKNKPWITSCLQKPISVKNKLLTILLERPYTKRSYTFLLSTVMKKSKQIYYDKYFERNWNNIKNA